MSLAPDKDNHFESVDTTPSGAKKRKPLLSSELAGHCEERGNNGRDGPEVKVHISYMEIYQDTGYDLLNPGAMPGALMLTLPKVLYTIIIHKKIYL